MIKDGLKEVLCDELIELARAKQDIRGATGNVGHQPKSGAENTETSKKKLGKPKWKGSILSISSDLEDSEKNTKKQFHEEEWLPGDHFDNDHARVREKLV